MLMSTEMIASVLYANENEVSPVSTHLVVLWAQNTPGSFSAHLPLALLTILHRLSRMVWLLISAWLLPWNDKVRKIDGRYCTWRRSWPLVCWRN